MGVFHPVVSAKPTRDCDHIRKLKYIFVYFISIKASEQKPKNHGVKVRSSPPWWERLAAADPSDVAAQVDYGSPVTAAVAKGAVFGVQFHPESLMSLGNEVGLRIVENAFRLNPPAN